MLPSLLGEPFSSLISINSISILSIYPWNDGIEEENKVKPGALSEEKGRRKKSWGRIGRGIRRRE